MRTNADTRTTTDAALDGDRGSVLILTLLLTIVLAAIVLALATYAATGLRTSKVTTGRTESNAVASTGATWAIEEFAKKRLDPEPTGSGGDCDDSLDVPAGLEQTGETIEVECATRAPIDGHPTVLLTARGVTASGVDRTIDVVLQVPTAQYTAQVYSWVAD